MHTCLHACLPTIFDRPKGHAKSSKLKLKLDQCTSLHACLKERLAQLRSQGREGRTELSSETSLSEPRLQPELKSPWHGVNCTAQQQSSGPHICTGIDATYGPCGLHGHDRHDTCGHGNARVHDFLLDGSPLESFTPKSGHDAWQNVWRRSRCLPDAQHFSHQWWCFGGKCQCRTLMLYPEPRIEVPFVGGRNNMQQGGNRLQIGVILVGRSGGIILLMHRETVCACLRLCSIEQGIIAGVTRRIHHTVPMLEDQRKMAHQLDGTTTWSFPLEA